MQGVNFNYPQSVQMLDTYLGLARAVYIHRIWPYIWWFPCQNYRVYTVYIWFWPTLHVPLILLHNMAQFRRHPPGLVIQFRRYPCRLDTQFERRPTASASCQTCSCQPSQEIQHKYIGLARTIDIGCMYDIFGRKITEYTVIYGVYNTVLAIPIYIHIYIYIYIYVSKAHETLHQ
jgi:hypothetical protein